VSKHPFDIDRVMARIGEAVADLPKAAMFELADEGFGTPFELLVACVISIRTRDETTLVCARRLFALARTAEEMSQLSAERIDRAIHLSHRKKRSRRWYRSRSASETTSSREICWMRRKSSPLKATRGPSLAPASKQGQGPS